jgi:hypothetical protein
VYWQLPERYCAVLVVEVIADKRKTDFSIHLTAEPLGRVRPLTSRERGALQMLWGMS